VVGILSIVAEIYNVSVTSVADLCALIEKQLQLLVTARPTAVNMADARDKLLHQLHLWTRDQSITCDELKHR